MRRRKFLALGLAGTALVADGATWHAFANEMTRARARLQGRSEIFQGRFGTMEYADVGTGPPILMIHGTGGGFDQGLDFAQPLISNWRVIAPSRFGYLRSTFPADPSSENQADTFVELLDWLKIDRAAVIGGSAGALSAMQFAIRYPDRCRALVALVPTSYAPGRPPVRPPNAIAQAIIEYGLRSDVLFWLGMTVNEDAMIGALLATDPALVRDADDGERARVRAMLRNILPVSDRARRLLNDGKLAGDPSPMPLATIRVPTLAISFADDRFETLAAARHIAAEAPGARIIAHPTGDHIWVGNNREVFAEINQFLSDVLQE